MVRGLPDSAIYGTYKRLASLSRGNGRVGVPSRGGKLSIDFSYKFKGLVFRQPQFDIFLNSTSGTVGRYVRTRGKMILAAAKIQVGKDTGALERSINMVHNRLGTRGHIMTIGSPLDYALVHHEGSRPHVITPRDANILRFSSGGRVIYTHKVNHPGTRPNRYLSDQLWMVRI